MVTKTDLRILVVDDEVDICEILQFNLENEGYIVDVANSAEVALDLMKNEPSLILLDVMMGGISGFKMADKLRKEGNSTPIIFLTARDTENDMLTGFSIGGDDYISKPFSIKEVIARVKSVLKRTVQSEQEEKEEDSYIKKGELEIDLLAKIVLMNNERLNLTKTEFNILTLLLENEGKVFSRTEILDYAWKNEGIVLERTVDVHITRLRKKLGEYGNKIVNRTGYGYVFNIEP